MVLSEERPHMGRLHQAMCEFGKQRRAVERVWNQHKDNLNSVGEVLEKFGIYEKFVMHNTKVGDKYLREAQGLREKEKVQPGEGGLWDKVCTSPEPLIIVRPDGHDILISDCNQAFCSIIRYKRLELLDRSKILSKQVWNQSFSSRTTTTLSSYSKRKTSNL